MHRTVSLLLVLAALVRAEPPGLSTVFDEDFKEVAQNRFKTLRPGQTDQNLAAGRVTMHPGTGWVRPAFAGFTAEYSFKLEFPPLANDGDTSEVDFSFVLANRQIAIVRLQRNRTNGQTSGVIQIGKAFTSGGMDKTAILRSAPQKGDLSAGEWTARFHHGLVVVRHDDKELARGFLDMDSTAVIGVTWEQRQAKQTCAGMKLRGILPPGQSPEVQAQLQQASLLNQQGLQAFKMGKVQEALKLVSEASVMFVKVLGEKHHDSANSFANVAMLLQSVGKLDEAKGLLERTLAIRTEVVGADHPHTGQAMLNLATLLVQMGMKKEARELAEKSLGLFEATHAADHATLKAAKALLDRLQ